MLSFILFIFVWFRQQQITSILEINKNFIILFIPFRIKKNKWLSNLQIRWLSSRAVYAKETQLLRESLSKYFVSIIFLTFHAG